MQANLVTIACNNNLLFQIWQRITAIQRKKNEGKFEGKLRPVSIFIYMLFILILQLPKLDLAPFTACKNTPSICSTSLREQAGFALELGTGSEYIKNHNTKQQSCNREY